MKLSIKGFALAAAVVLGLAMFAGTWLGILIQGAETAANYDGILTQIYWKYQMTPVGSVIGAAWGFVEGLIGGGIFALLYNAFAGEGN